MVLSAPRLPKSLSALKPLSESLDATIDFFSSGLPSLDIILGGGYPKGRIVDISGPKSSGKTTLALEAVKQAQKHGQVHYLHSQHALEADYAAAVGVNTDLLLFKRPQTAEETLQLAWDAAKAGFALVVIDSMASMPIEQEANSEMGELHKGLHKEILNEGIKRIVQDLGGGSPTTLLTINQIRILEGVVYGAPERTTGTEALGYHASIALDLRAMHTLKRGHHEYGHRIKLKTSKNKVASPFQVTEIDLVFGQGFPYIHGLFDLAEELEVVGRVSHNYTMGQISLGKGRDAALDTLKADPQLVKELEGAIAQCRKDL